MDGKKDFYESLDELAERNRKLVDGEEGEPRAERGRKVDIQMLREIIYSLESVSIGTHQLLYFAAMKYADRYIDAEADTLEAAIEELADIFDAMELGTLERAGTDSPDTVELAENAFTHNAPQSDRTMCYFISGYIAGFLENALGRKYVVNEVRCSAEGEEVCAFELRER